jgi:myo-inositol-1(or 4)-monophosphatase
MILPQAGFITEEGTASNNAEQYVWIIDPLDGTTNFIHKCPPYSISVALMYNHELIMGVIHEITSGDTFYSWLGHDVYLNDDKIHVSQVDKLADSFIATGFPYINYQRIDPYMELLRYLMEQTPGVRRLGSAAIDLAYVAAGRFEAFFEYNLNPWDVAAGAFLVHQAGGRVSDFKGGQDYLFGNEIIACNSNMYDEFQKVLSGFMNK